ncbi:MAG: hypothetical protein QOI48_2757 [Solirubrobacteraceae bacterium]|nr:hypothetical protein [Solirubrobacteraceae bacterium]
MSAIVSLSPGANQSLDGRQISVELSAGNLGGVLLAVEERGVTRPLTPADGVAPPTVDGANRAQVRLALASIPESITRLRLLVWSESRTRVLVPAQAHVSVDGTHRFTVAVSQQAGLLRAVEILEIYRRHGSWKVRAVASGWEDGIPAMARAIGLPEAAFNAPAGAAPSRPAPPPARSHTGPSPQVGPRPLRDLLDSVVGPGPRGGDSRFVDFEIRGVHLRLRYEAIDGAVQIVAIVPLGRGQFTDASAEAALRVTGEAPLARVIVDEQGNATASAVAHAAERNLDSALVKALLSEVWVAAYSFSSRVQAIGWPFPRHITAEIPRELRLGVAEELQETQAWADVRERLLANQCLPLVDEPAALLALVEHGQLSIGPSLLAGTSRAWAIIVERILRANVTPRAGLWRALAQGNTLLSPVRFGLVDEVGLHGPPAVTVNFAALQLPRTQVMEDLQSGLEYVEQAATEAETMMRSMTPDATSHRNNLPWIPTRRWTGPGTEVRNELLVRELNGLPDGARVPEGFADRVRSQQASLGRAGLGYIAHLALVRAERVDGASPGWLEVARDLVALVPVEAGAADEPCAAASIHVRLNRCDNPAPPRRGTATSSPPTPQPSPPDDGASPATRRRWRLFG